MTYDYGLWWLVAVHVAWLTVFALAFLRPARRREWRSFGALTAFVVALYMEMYGFPLTIYVLAALLGWLAVPEPFAHISGNLWATLMLGPWAAGPLMLLGGLLMLGGLIVLSMAWRTLHRAHGELVTRRPTDGRRNHRAPGAPSPRSPWARATSIAPRPTRWSRCC